MGNTVIGSGVFMTTLLKRQGHMQWRMLRFLMEKVDDNPVDSLSTIPLGNENVFPVCNTFDLAKISDLPAPPMTHDLRTPPIKPPDHQAGALVSRLILNGFPKSGLHFAAQMVLPTLRPFMVVNWIGTFEHQGWSAEWRDTQRAVKVLEVMDGGSFVIGHVGYHEDIVTAMRDRNAGMVFIFRDLRDVVASIKRHLEKPHGQTWIHEGRRDYLDIEGDENRTLAIVEGFGEYAGVMERWAQYAPWLERHNVLPMPYEFMTYFPDAAYRLCLRFILGQATIPFNLVANLVEADVVDHGKTVIQFMENKNASPTYVQGKVGSWRGIFTPRVRAAFDATGGSEWLVRLGYERSVEWE